MHNTQLVYTTLRLHHITPQVQLQLQLALRTLLRTTLDSTKYTALQLQLQLQLHYTNYITLRLQLQHATLQLPLQLHLYYTTLHPAVVGEVTTATIVTTLKKTTPITFRSRANPCITTSNLSYSVLSLKLPPRPCAALLVSP